MKYLLFLLLFAFNFGQTWNTTTGGGAYDIASNLHIIGNDIYMADEHGNSYKYINGVWTKTYNDFTSYPYLTTKFNTTNYELGSTYDVQNSDGVYFYWASNKQGSGQYSGRSTRLRILDSTATLLKEATITYYDKQYVISLCESGGFLNDSTYVASAQRKGLVGGEGDSYYDDYSYFICYTYSKQANTITITYHKFKDSDCVQDEDGTNTTTYPVYQIFSNYGKLYCLQGVRTFKYKDFLFGTVTLQKGLKLLECSGDLDNWTMVKEWDDVNVASDVIKSNGRTYLLLENPDTLGSTERGLWKLYRGVCKKINAPVTDSSYIFTGLYSYSDNIFMATSNGTVNELQHYYMGKWHKSYTLPYLITEMKYFDGKFFAKYAARRQYTFTNNSESSDPLPQWTPDIPIYTDKANYFIGIK